MNVQEELNQIRERQGLMPIDGTRIQGDGPWPEPPPLPPNLIPTEFHPEPDEFPMDEPLPPEPPSPLVLAARPQPAPAIKLAIENPDLAVLDANAAYRGRQVILNDQEKSKIVGVVILAIRRNLEEQLAEIGVPKRRRRRVKGQQLSGVTQPAGGPPDSSPPPTVKRRRGRPPKVQPVS